MLNIINSTITIMALITCPECGAKVSDQAVACPKCGSPLNSVPSQRTTQHGSAYQQPAYQQVAPVHQQVIQRTNPSDVPNGGLNVLSFFFPLVGFILWGVFKRDTPIKAKSCAKWAWISIAITFVLYVIYGVIIGLSIDY